MDWPSLCQFKYKWREQKQISTFSTTENWVAENYTQEYVENTKEYFFTGTIFFSLYEGASKVESKKCNYIAEFVSNTKLKWKQEKNERSCMILCAANF